MRGRRRRNKENGRTEKGSVCQGKKNDPRSSVVIRDETVALTDREKRGRKNGRKNAGGSR